jgi:predicted enzyme related to lactoylglutathione lyase
MSDAPCNFAWHELMTIDTAAAAAFYSSVVGWTTTDVGSSGMHYTTFDVGAVGVAGLLALPAEAGPVPAWIGYIHVPDVDAHVERLVEAGGKLHRGPTDVPGMLRFAVVSDAEGAPLVLFTADPRMPSNPEKPAPGTAGTVGWCELMATDGDAAFAFYSGLFGWTKGEAHDMGAMGTYQVFQVNGVPTGGVMSRPPNVPGPFWSYYFNVDAIGAAITRIHTGGGRVVHGPQAVPGGQWVVQAVDPQGAGFALVSWAA